jgi:hypothetical protein
MAGYQLTSTVTVMDTPGQGQQAYNSLEEYDPSLIRLNTIDKLSSYCDSLFNSMAENDPTVVSHTAFPEIASAVVQKRFYHGYSFYDLNKNFMAMALSNATIKGLGAIVIPNDILKYPYAACSQQSIVLMEMLQSKGFPTRSVGFEGDRTGHFCFETFYNGDWHFFDPDNEPDINVLKAHNIPSIAFLNANKNVLVEAYPQHSKEYVLDVFTKYSYGAINTFPAPRAILFQKVSLFLSYTLWSFFLLAFVWTRRKYKKLTTSTAIKNRRHGYVIQAPVSSVYSPA